MQHKGIKKTTTTMLKEEKAEQSRVEKKAWHKIQNGGCRRRRRRQRSGHTDTHKHTHTETTNDVCGNATYANLLENAWQYFCVFQRGIFFCAHNFFFVFFFLHFIRTYLASFAVHLQFYCVLQAKGQWESGEREEEKKRKRNTQAWK